MRSGSLAVQRNEASCGSTDPPASAVLRTRRSASFKAGAAILAALICVGCIGVAGEELGYVGEILGWWEVKYPGPDGMISEAYIEKLELRRDGSYFWNPSPAWAPATGKWGVVRTQDGKMRLCFQEKQGRLRCNYMVLMQMEKGGPFFLHWQRTPGDAVIFADRIFRADRPRNWAPRR